MTIPPDTLDAVYEQNPAHRGHAMRLRVVNRSWSKFFCECGAEMLLRGEAHASLWAHTERGRREMPMRLERSLVIHPGLVHPFD